ncbi:hypothetical protein O6H91_19G063300 [Diphasiastrum complanatum]|uniref:Uncharacterized protein n=1 Tax=Diphasiastrum complanatum TaxID=34168 RepID=A0ACC2AVY5_DIPCM|nr:hypothetical protein O6H91_19G063300 [Diphasiastrum complanatum]
MLHSLACRTTGQHLLSTSCSHSPQILSFHGFKKICFYSSRYLPLKQQHERHGTKTRRENVARWISASRTSTDDATLSAVEDVVLPGSVSIILLSGGQGKRMGATMPKQYLPLLGQPIALYSFLTLANLPEAKEIVVVCDPSYRDIFAEAGKSIQITLKFALPGKERQDSVLSGLQEISNDARLACIHDSARPLILSKDVQEVLKDAWIHGAAVLGVPVKATIKEAGDDHFVTRTLDRRTLWEMQTPQVIQPDLLRRGFDYVKREQLEVTDDVSIVEYLKHPVIITEGSYTNLKVTTPEDLVIAERIIHNTINH